MVVGVDAAGDGTIDVRGTQRLRFAVAGVYRAEIDASGNLGLGVTPSYRLHAVAATTYVSYLRNSVTATGVVLGGDASGGIVSSDSTATPLQLQIGGVTKATLDAAGNVLVGTQSAPSAGKMRVAAVSSGATLQLERTTTSAGSGFLGADSGNALNVFDSSINQRFYVTQGGACYNTTGTYGTISDLKLKDGIVDASPKLAKLLQVRIVNYTLKNDPNKLKQLGVVAQELELISPGLISETADFETITKTREVRVPEVPAVFDDEGNEVSAAVEATTRTEEYTEQLPTGTTTKTVKYSVFVPMLIKGLQEQHAIVEALQNQLDAQNTAMQLMADRLAALESK
jgi:hypothetical protein